MTRSPSNHPDHHVADAVTSTVNSTGADAGSAHAGEENARFALAYRQSRRQFLQKTGTALSIIGSSSLIAACGGGGGSASPEAHGAPRGAVPPATGNGGGLQPPSANAVHPPRGVHVSVHEHSVTTRGLCWFTDGLDDPGSFVQWGPVEADWSEADIHDVDNHPLPFQTQGSAEKTTGLDNATHKVLLLDMDQQMDVTKPLRYRVGSPSGWSDIFVVEPTPPADQPWTFVHFGDHGTTHRAVMLMDELRQPQYAHSLLLLAGDIAYADGTHEVWDTWFDQNEPHLATHVTMTTPGNHENKDADVQDDDFTTIPTFAYDNRFNQPGENTYYGFDYNRVHIFAFTAGAFLEDGQIAQELALLEADLAQAAARRAAGEIDFIAVMQHYTIWTDQAGRAPGNGSLIALEEEILARYGVDFLMCGHDHVYQRSKRMYKGQPDDTGLGYIQIMAGTGGHSIRLFEPSISEWSAKEFIGIGFAEYTVDNDTITCRYYGSPPVDIDNRDRATGEFTLVDEFQIQKRSATTAKLFRQPARSAEQIVADAGTTWEQVRQHTAARNARLRAEHDHDHGHAHVIDQG